MITETALAACTRIEELRSQMKTESRNALQTVFRELFAQFPEIKTVYWAQYTPYFNDGDPCTFSIHDIYFSPVEWEKIDGPYFGDEIEEDELMNFEVGSWRDDYRVTESMRDAIKSVRKLLNDIEDQLAEIYDDHCWVRVHKDGVVVEEYSHD